MSEQTSWQFGDFGELLYLDGILTQFAVKNNGREIAYVYDEKDARLMAAAPDLLAALQSLTGETRGLREALAAMAQARAALAKATKEQTA